MADDEHSKKAKKPSGALNVERRTWDLEHFQEVAKERLEKEASGESEKKKPGFVRKREEFQSAEQGAAGPEGSKRAYLKHREADLGLEDKVYERKLEEEGAVKEQWKEARKEARRKIAQRAAEEEDDGEGGGEEEDEMAAMMGFGGFGGK
eukprot:evm.model.NODE_304_length_7458_cov_52.294716.2